MSANVYRFHDEWFIPHPIEKVWPHIYDGAAYPKWWRCWDSVVPLNEKHGNEVGARTRITAHGFLPYHVRLVLEVTSVDAPYTLAVKSTGDLNGRGLWTLRAAEGGTAITYEWIVQADKPLIKLFSPIVKPLFAQNHHYTMQTGEASLKRLLANEQ